MTASFVLFLLAASVSLSTGRSPLCAAVCHCEDFDENRSHKMDCSRVSLSIIPPFEDWPANVTHADFSTNIISTLDTELSHDTLQVLDLSNNKISSVIQSAFGGLKKLTYLNLANNLIGSFEDTGFYGLDHLKSLNISSNKLRTLPEKLLYNFLGLQELSLADNPLIHVDPIHFNRMVALRWLDISNIEAYTLPGNIFHTTLQLEFLDLSGNDFHDVPIDALRSAQKLKHLRLNENPIDYLDNKSFIKLNSLQSLELNTMDRLTRVMEGTFSTLLNLTTLQMKYNRKLSLINPLAFDGLFNMSRPTLQELDLEGNQLQTLSANMVRCGRMRIFNVQKNPLVCDCKISWLKKCHIQPLYAADLKCHSPSALADNLILNVEDKDLKCDKVMMAGYHVDENHHDHVVRSMTIGIAAGFLVVLAVGLAVIFKWRDIKTWYKYGKKGPGAVYYVRARANPREI